MTEHVITKKEFTQLMADANRHQADQEEANGRHGQAVSQYVKSHGLNAKAFKFVQVLTKQEITKQQEYLRSLLLYADYAEMFDSVDAFDNLGQMMIDIGKGIKSRAAPAPADRDASSTVAQLVQ